MNVSPPGDFASPTDAPARGNLPSHPPASHPRLDADFAAGVFALGATSVATQVLVLRECLSVFYGNELVIGIILANWMLLTAAGSWLGRVSRRWEMADGTLAFILFILPILPPSTLAAVRLLRNIVFTAGAMAGMNEIILSTFILLIPYCLLSGFTFTFISWRAWTRSGENLIRKVYGWEALGSMAGGIVFSLILVFILKPFQSLGIFALFDFGVALWILVRRGRTGSAAILALPSTALVCLLLFGGLDDLTARELFKGQEMLLYEETPYGTLGVTSQSDQNNLFENNVLLSTSNDVPSAEEAVHYAMSQHPNPHRVLVISGGMSGLVPEILKYQVDRIDDVELNPSIVDIGRRFIPVPADNRFSVIAGDARRYVATAASSYDVVLINLPEPGTAQLNRYYTEEFFESLKKLLTNGGVVSTSLISSEDYMSAESRQTHSVLLNTLRSVFRHAVIVPGMRDYFLASDGDLSVAVASLVRERGIATTYVNDNYLDDGLLKDRSDTILRSLDKGAPVNRDFDPASYYRQLLYWLSQFREKPWVFIGAGVVLLALLSVRMNAITFGVFAGGFAGSAVEIVLIIAFQIVYGYVYIATGIMVTIFMGGLALGAWQNGRSRRGTSVGKFIALESAVGACALFIPLLLAGLVEVSRHLFIVQAGFALILLVISFLVGEEFAEGSKLAKGSVAAIASDLYGVDLVGSAIGALLVSTLLIPLIGMSTVCFITAALSFAGAVVTAVRRKAYAVVL